MWRIVLLISALLLTLAACVPSPRSVSEPRGNAEATTASHCGIERWPVKTGTDAGAAQIDLTNVQKTTVGLLTSNPEPAVLPQSSRIAPMETSVFRIVATLVKYKIEADQDIHMVLVDGPDHMVAEIPDPQCAAGSAWLSQITTARGNFDEQFHPSTSWQLASTQITIVGIGFFDKIHGQTGVAPDGVGIHPVLSYEAIG